MDMTDNWDLHGCLPTFPEPRPQQPAMGKRSVCRAASVYLFYICYLVHLTASQWWAVMLTNCCPRCKTSGSPMEHRGFRNLPWVYYFKGRGSWGNPIFLTHWNQESQAVISVPLLRGSCVGDICNVTCWLLNSLVISSSFHGRNKPWRRENKARNVPLKFPKLRENL